MIRTLAVLATSIALFSPIIIRNNIFCNVKVFPMRLGNKYRIDFTYVLNSGMEAEIMIRHKYDHFNRAVYLKTFTSTGELHDSFEINIREEQRSNRIIMEAQTEKYGTKTYEFTLNTVEEIPYINLNESSTFDNPNALIEIDKYGKLEIYYENIFFKNFYKNFEIPTSLYFDLSQLEIIYKSNYYHAISEFTSVTLGLLDTKNLFPGLVESSIYHAKMIELELIEEELGIVKFGFKDKLYVDKTTRMMSLEQEEGFVETKNLYFPVNRHDDLESGLTFFISFEHFGILNLDFHYYATCLPLKKIIGDCLSSSYCVVTEETNLDDNETESMVYSRD